MRNINEDLTDIGSLCIEPLGKDHFPGIEAVKMKTKDPGLSLKKMLEIFS